MAEGRYSVVAPTTDDPNAPSPFWSRLKAGGTMEWDDELAGMMGYDKEAYRKAKRRRRRQAPVSIWRARLPAASPARSCPAVSPPGHWGRGCAALLRPAASLAPAAVRPRRPANT